MLNALEKELLGVLESILGADRERYPNCNLLPDDLRRAQDVVAKAKEYGKDHPQGEAIRALAVAIWDDEETTVVHDAPLHEAEEDGGVWVTVQMRLNPDKLEEHGIITEGMANATDDDDGCPKGDPDCLGKNGDCHDACESPPAAA